MRPVVLCVVLAPIAAGLILLGAASLPALVGYRSYVVLSGSMEPAVPVGSVVVSQVVNPEEVRVGDVITFSTDRQAGVNVTHRVIAVEVENRRLSIHTRGDANASADPGIVDVNQSLGRMVYVVPWVGYMVDALRTSRVRLLVAGAALLLVCLRQLLGAQPLARLRRLWSVRRTTPTAVVVSHAPGGELPVKLVGRAHRFGRAARRLAGVVVVVADISLLATFAPGLAGYRTVPVGSSRLEPEIPFGAMLVEEPREAQRLQPDDVISLSTPQAPGTIFTDRVRAVTDLPDTQSVDVHTRPVGTDQARSWRLYRTQPVGRMLYWVPLTGLFFNYPIMPFLIAAFGLLLVGQMLLWKARGQRAPERIPGSGGS